VGYWRSPADLKPSKLVCIRLIEGRYFLWWTPTSARASLVVEGNRLVRHHYYPNGQEMEREVFWARPGGTLAFTFYLHPSDTTSPSPTPPIVNFTKATGTAAQLAAELRGRFAVPTIEKQVGILVNALGDWASRHGGFPPRAALLPGGAFWKWKGAPHLTNAVSGGPMVLGSGAGNFDYTSTGNFSGSYSYSISGHLPYGLGEYTTGESRSP